MCPHLPLFRLPRFRSLRTAFFWCQRCVFLPGILPRYRTARIYIRRQSIVNAHLLRFIACCLRLDERTEGLELVGITAYIIEMSPPHLATTNLHQPLGSCLPPDILLVQGPQLNYIGAAGYELVFNIQASSKVVAREEMIASLRFANLYTGCSHCGIAK